MKKSMVLILTGVLLLCGLTACGTAKEPENNTDTAVSEAESKSETKPTEPSTEGETYELDVAITFGEPATRHILASLDEVTEKSGGRVTFNVYPSNSLISIPEIPDALKDGVADIAVVPSVNYPSVLTYNAEMIGMPFSGIEDSYMACDLWNALYAEFPELEEEWQQLGAHVWYTYATPGYNLYMTDKDSEVHTPADLAGHKVMSGKTQWLDVVNKNGGAGIQAAPTVYYENLEKGVADSVIQSYGTVRTFGCLELIHGATEFGTEGSYYDMFFIAISNNTWDSLPEDIQQIFTEVNADNAASVGENDRSMEDLANAYKEAPEDMNTAVLTEEELGSWYTAFEEVNQSYLTQLADTYKKDKVSDMYDFMKDWIEQNSK